MEEERLKQIRVDDFGESLFKAYCICLACTNYRDLEVEVDRGSRFHEQFHRQHHE